ncbi:MAG: molybdopterin-synthase adenylyltransferase MoeB, partial [Gammaproteobacteria bacterium]|nr:molybdopterin-synthase adenylyltransferase MoeB [Gammaproteobacteria bacterium]
MDDDELLRYSRQIMLPEVDVAGQEKLRDAKALVVGLGGLGSP